MSSIFGILNRKKKFDEPSEPEIQTEKKTLDLTSIVESNRKEKNMNADELHSRTNRTFPVEYRKKSIRQTKWT